ncbi:MAG: hypothetical protein J6T79_00540 [Verrucomicrobia bacterium]|jgi:hypothetical protein|nr:hypothetical protein [Verrucomicrobiota bacterium]MBR4248640.1 hypothetical protein [Verrucomicrobiota bacterium]
MAKRRYSAAFKGEKKSLPYLFFVLTAGTVVLLVLILGLVRIRLDQRNHDLGERIRACEMELRNIKQTNEVLAKELILLKSPDNIFKRAEQEGIYWNYTSPTQTVRLPEVEETFEWNKKE